MRGCLSVGLGSLWLLVGFGVQAAPEIRSAALIQEHGLPLGGGSMEGGSQVTLERAVGGDTPVLTFASEFGPVRLLLDTGAAFAMVSPGLAERLDLHLHPLPSQTFSLAGGGANCQALKLSKTLLPELRLFSSPQRPPLRLHGLEALVTPGLALPKGVDGVLGAPSLKQLPIVVDPLMGTVLFGQPALHWRRAIASQPEVIPLAWRRGVPVVPMRVQPRADQPARVMDALADTGAEGLFLTARFAQTLTPLGPPLAARLVGACGEQRVYRQRLTGIGLGPQGSSNLSVEAILTSNPVFSLLGVEAIVGQELLRSHRQLWRLDANPSRLELW